MWRATGKHPDPARERRRVQPSLFGSRRCRAEVENMETSAHVVRVKLHPLSVLQLWAFPVLS